MLRTVTLATAAVLSFAAPALAGTAEFGPSDVYFDAKPGENNVLSIEHDGQSVILRDAGAPIDAGAGCVEIADGVRCEGGPVIASLGDGNDVATATDADIYGEAGDDRLTSSRGTVSGGPGNDVVTAQRMLDDDGRRPGRDIYVGLPRTDFGTVEGASLSYETRPAGVRVDLRGGRSEDRITGVSEVRGGKGDDVLIGSEQADRLFGLEGEDRVVGLGGNDELYGEDVSGGAGDDWLLGESAVLAPRCGPGEDGVDSSGNSLVGADCEWVGGARPRMRLPDAGAPFLYDMQPCRCASVQWQATVRGRTVAFAEPGTTLTSLSLNALGQRLLRRERVLRVRVNRRTFVYGIEGGSFPLRSGFRIDLRLANAPTAPSVPAAR